MPYGIDDLRLNRGYFYFGQLADTSELAVDAIVQWWESAGKVAYPQANRLLIWLTREGVLERASARGISNYSNRSLSFG